MEFKANHSFEQRVVESKKIRYKYPDRVPVICEVHSKDITLVLDKKKYLVPVDVDLGQLLYIIRKRVKLQPAQAIFIFVQNKTLTSSNMLLGQLYDQYKDDDGFLYFTLSLENVFG